MGKRRLVEVAEANNSLNPRAPKGWKGDEDEKPSEQSWDCYPGMIMRVKMKNFMCHAELDYRPTERLNFLHGANGSGKVPN